MRKTTDVATRLWRGIKVGKPSECWLWMRGNNGKYGQLYEGPRGAVIYHYAHRLVYQLTYGRTIPQGMYVCHSCDVPLYCNPAHLFLGTPSDNISDAYHKGRRPKLARDARGRIAKTAKEIL